MYKLLRPLLFRYDPERAHHLTFNLLEVAVKVPGCSLGTGLTLEVTVVVVGSAATAVGVAL